MPDTLTPAERSAIADFFASGREPVVCPPRTFAIDEAAPSLLSPKAQYQKRGAALGQMALARKWDGVRRRRERVNALADGTINFAQVAAKVGVPLRTIENDVKWLRANGFDPKTSDRRGRIRSEYRRSLEGA